MNKLCINQVGEDGVQRELNVPSDQRTLWCTSVAIDFWQPIHYPYCPLIMAQLYVPGHSWAMNGEALLNEDMQTSPVSLGDGGRHGNFVTGPGCYCVDPLRDVPRKGWTNGSHTGPVSLGWSDGTWDLPQTSHTHTHIIDKALAPKREIWATSIPHPCRQSWTQIRQDESEELDHTHADSTKPQHSTLTHRISFRNVLSMILCVSVCVCMCVWVRLRAFR